MKSHPMRQLPYLFLALAFLFASFPSWAQSIEWDANYGGSNDEDARRTSMKKTDDGGLILIGHSKSNDLDVSGNYGNWDIWVVKIDTLGNIEWEKHYGGSGPDRAKAIVQTDDGGYFLGGESGSSDHDVSGNNGNYDIWVLKLDSNGTIEWEKNFGGTYQESGQAVLQTENGNFLVGGYSSSSDQDVSGNYGFQDSWILKLDASGGVIWEEHYGGSNDDEVIHLLEKENGNYIVSCNSESFDHDVSGNNGQTDAWVFEMDPSGTIQWEDHYGGSSNEEVSSVARTGNGGYTIAGLSSSSDQDVSGNYGYFDYWVFQIDSTGTLEWERNYGGNDVDRSKAIAKGIDGGYVITGMSKSSSEDVSMNHGAYDYWTIKVDSLGNMEWERNYGGSSGDTAFSIAPVDTGYVMGGISGSDDIDPSNNKGGMDYWIVGVEDSTIASSIDGRSSTSGPDLRIHPNPTEGPLRIRLGKRHEDLMVRIRDLTGRTIRSERVEHAASFRTTIEGEPGLYFVELRTEDGWSEVRRVLKE